MDPPQIVTITVFGASGAIGRRVVERALAGGHQVRAFVRDRTKAPTGAGMQVEVGDIADAVAVLRAVEGADAVVWAIGPSSNTPDQVSVAETGAQNLVEAMRTAGVRRIVALSGAGITIEGETKPLAGRLMSGFVGIMVRHVVEAKRREYAIFSASGLDWTLVRPPRVVPGDPTGNVVAGNELRGRSVTEGDLAQLMIDQLADDSSVGKSPFVSTA